MGAGRMTDLAPVVYIRPLLPLCYKCIGPRGHSYEMPFEDRRHPYHEDGSVNEDDIEHWLPGGVFAPPSH
jgi:hypothetical protein